MEIEIVQKGICSARKYSKLAFTEVLKARLLAASGHDWRLKGEALQFCSYCW